MVWWKKVKEAIDPVEAGRRRDEEALKAVRAGLDQARRDYVPSPAFIAYAERMRAAATDPAFKSKRDKLVRVLRRRITEACASVGLVEDGQDWALVGRHHRVVVNLQRGRAGHEAYINLGVRTLSGERPSGPEFAMQDYVRLGRFYAVEERPGGGEPGSVEYALAMQDPAHMDFALQVLRDRALPWLLCCAQTSRVPEVTWE